MAPVLTARGLTYRYGTHTALRDFDLEVTPGEVVALLGANGSGKTTALRCVAGQLSPSEGVVTVAGADPHREPEAEQARRALAFVPDTPVFYRGLSIAEHVRLVAAAFDDPQGVERGEAVLAELGLADRLALRPHELSSGQRQKALLACVHARPFTGLLLDEPVLRLDPASQAWLHRRLRAHREAGVAIVLTTHHPAFANGLAARVLCLEEGRIAADETFASFLARGADARIGHQPDPGSGEAGLGLDDPGDATDQR